MKKSLFVALVGFSLMAVSEGHAIQAGAGYPRKVEAVKPPTIKVLIAKKKPGVLFEVKGKYKMYDPNTMEHLGTRFIGKRKYMQPLAQGLKWGEEFPGVYQLLIMPDDAKTTTLVDGIEYRGSIYIYDVEGMISVVNEVEVEDFLNSVMSTQANGAVPEEVLGAMAISNRTQAYYQASHPKTSYWAVDGEKMGYDGHAATEPTSTVAKSLQTTKYMVLTEAEQPFEAIWAKAKISVTEAEKLAKEGFSAAQILGKAFPGSTMKVMLNNQ